MQLAQSRAFVAAERPMPRRTVRSVDRSTTRANARVVLICGAASMLPLAVIVVLIIRAPFAPAATLLWPLVALALTASGGASLAALALSQPQQRSITQLHRAMRRVVSGDALTLPLDGDVAPEFHPLASELTRLASEVERLRLERERLDRELKTALAGREHLVGSLAIMNRKLKDEASIVHEFVETVNRPVGREQMCLQLLRVLEDEVPYQEAIVYLADADTGRLRPTAVWDRERNNRHGGRYVGELANFSAELANPRSLPIVVFQTGRSIVVSDSTVDHRFVGLKESLRSYLAVPVELKERVIGVLQIGTPEPNRYDEQDEQRVGTLARFAALWLENVRLLQEAAKVEALRKVDQLKSELLSVVSHELRTPLASIKGYTSSLLRVDVDWDDETRREFLQIIEEESDRLGALIEDLLQMSEIEAGVLRVTKQPVRVERLAQKVVKKLRPQAADHAISVHTGHELPETMGDPRRIEQVLHNLVVNAIKYSPEPTPIAVRVDRRGEEILVTVRDHGIGIPPEHQVHVFDRFYRVEGAMARETRGSGLGLPICHGLVGAHGGKIWVESESGKGSSFYFTLPIVAVPPTDGDGEDVALERGAED